jgi:hypothetical protein
MAGDGTAHRCRVNAEKSLELAHSAKDLENKRILLGMANAWLTLAEQLLKDGDKRPPRRPTPDPRSDPNENQSR